MKLIVGLGNPGEKYAKVRHNLGFMVLDELISNWEASKELKSLIAQKDDLLFAKPQTYMNNSGLAVTLLSSAFSLQSSDIIVVHDDLDLPLGKIKIRLGGAAAGHHGVESIIAVLGTDQFIRVRLGIGNLRTQSSEHKKAHVDVEKFVLEPFMHSEKAKVKHMIKQALRALEILIKEGLEKAQNQFN